MHKEETESRVKKESQEYKELQERREKWALLENRDNKDDLGNKETWDQGENQGATGTLENRGHQGTMVVREELVEKVLRGWLELLDLMVLGEKRVWMDVLDTQGVVDHEELRGIAEKKVNREDRAEPEDQVAEVTVENLDSRAVQGFRELQDLKDHRATLAAQEEEACVVLTGKTENLEMRDFVDYLVKLVPLGHRVYLARMVNMEKMATLEPPAPKEIRDLQAKLANLDIRDGLAVGDALDPKDRKENAGHRDTLVLRA